MEERRIPPIDLRQLAYFMAVAERGSITAAADALGIAQPSLSDQIARLERKLDTRLIVRGARGIHLTEAGMALARHGGEILLGVDRAVEEVRHLGGEARGPVAVGFPPTIGSLLSVALAETIRNELPLVRLHIAEAMSGDILAWVHAERIELGCAYDVPDSTLLAVRPVLTEELFLLASPDNMPSEAGAAIGFADAAALPLVLPSRVHGTRELLERHAKASGAMLNVVTEIDSLPQMIAMVERASAYTILPHTAVIDQVARGTLALVRIAEPTVRRTACLVRKRSRSVSRASLAVEQAIGTIVREMVDRYRLQAALPAIG